MNTLEGLARPVHFGPRRLTHANLFVGALESSIDFYNKVCGLEVVMRQPSIGGGFLSNGNTHHDIGLIQATEKAVYGEAGHRILAEGQGSRPGLNHLGWEMESEFELTQAYKRAVAADFKIHRTVQHRASRSVYIFDPDGNVHEFYSDVDRDWRGRYRDGKTVSGQWTPGQSRPSMTPLYWEDPEIRRVDDAPVHPNRITHAVMVARNFERMRAFFANIAGLLETYADDALGVAAFQAPKTRSAFAVAVVRADRCPEIGQKGLHHISFEVPGEAELVDAERAFASDATPAERRIEAPHKRSFFVRDPDGTLVEFQARRRADPDFPSIAAAADVGFRL